MLVHLDPIWVKSDGQSSQLQKETNSTTAGMVSYGAAKAKNTQKQYRKEDLNSKL